MTYIKEKFFKEYVQDSEVKKASYEAVDKRLVMKLVEAEADRLQKAAS